MRDAWPEVLASLQRTKRSAWMVAFTAQVREFRDGEVLVLAFPSEQDVAGFRGGAPGQSVSELLRSAIAEVLGVTVKFIAKVEGPGSRAAESASSPSPTLAPDVDPGRPGAEARDAAPVTTPDVAADRSTPAEPGGSGRGSAGPAANGTAVTGSASTGAAPKGAAPKGVATKEAAPRGSRSSTPPSAASTSTSSAASGPVDSWATVAIPTGLEAEAASTASAAVGSGRTTATALAEPPAAASAASTEAPVDADIPDDADAPPEDLEPPFDPGPPPELVVEASVPRGGSGSAPVDGGIQRYGESVVREVLGATFLEEVEAPGRPGFGERG